eukprot:scaffold8282_cov73-Cylindrotheca_fusiformis.AAC.1
MTSEDHQQRHQASNSLGACTAATSFLLFVWVLFGGEGGEVATHSNSSSNNKKRFILRTHSRSPSERALDLTLLSLVALNLWMCCSLLCNCNNNTSRTRQNQYESVGRSDDNDSDNNNINAEIAL